MRYFLYKIRKEYRKFKGSFGVLLHKKDLLIIFILRMFPFNFLKYILIRIKGTNYKFKIRFKNSIDLGTLNSTFVEGFHRTNHLSKYNFSKSDIVIFDLGSNIGSTLVDFSSSFPGAKIFGFEMDYENYTLAKYNIRNYSNIKIINCAVWNRDEIVRYNKSTRFDGFYASNVTLTNAKDDFVMIQGITLDSLLKNYNIDFIDYLKMDIEGAEKQIFFSEKLNWLEKIGFLNIELHDFNNDELDKLIHILKTNNFSVEKHPTHWSSIYAFR
jgi:FkbM family methyltransferase